MRAYVRHLTAAATLVAVVLAAGVAGGTREPSRVVIEGVAVELRLTPVGEGGHDPLLERRNVTVSFRVTDPASGKPMAGLKPSAWIHPRLNLAGSVDSCKTTVQALLSASMGQRPAVDLNVFHVLALNEDASISVIDPLLSFGGSKLLAMVRLKSPGWDWVMSRDRRRLYVSQPAAGRIAAVDTTTWQVVGEVEITPRPTTLSLQHDQKYLWVVVDATDEGGALAAIDTATLKVAARLPLGRGPHALARSDDDRFVYATSAAGGTLSVVDTGRLAVVGTLPVGRRPTSLAFSPVGQAVYVADEAGGVITVVDAIAHAVRARIETRPGLVSVRFTPATRFGFAVNHAESVVEVIDPATSRIVHTVDVGAAPVDLGFSDAYAYVRSEGTHEVTMIPFAGLGTGPRVAVAMIAGGQRPAGETTAAAGADGIVPAPESGTVLIANPGDGTVYYYKEGMTAPMGSFRNFRRSPRAVLVVDRTLDEREPGVYATTAELPAAGKYTVPFLLGSPRVVHCFPLVVAADPHAAHASAPAVLIEPLLGSTTVEAGRDLALRVRVTGGAGKEPRSDLADLRVLVVQPGNWQRRAPAAPRGDGVYEATVALPRAGVYYVYFEVPSLRLKPNQLPHVILRAQPPGAPVSEARP